MHSLTSARLLANLIQQLAFSRRSFLLKVELLSLVLQFISDAKAAEKPSSFGSLHKLKLITFISFLKLNIYLFVVDRFSKSFRDVDTSCVLYERDIACFSFSTFSRRLVQ